MKSKPVLSARAMTAEMSAPTKTRFTNPTRKLRAAWVSAA